MLLKRCPRCKTEKYRDAFYKNSRTTSGVTCWCKDCIKICHALYRKTEDPVARRASDRRCYTNNNEHYKQKRKLWGIVTGYQYKRDKQKQSAKAAVKYAVKIGKLVRLPCELCGDAKTQAHHTDYTRKLDVMWLCGKHHGETWLKPNEQTDPKIHAQAQPAVEASLRD